MSRNPATRTRRTRLNSSLPQLDPHSPFRHADEGNEPSRFLGGSKNDDLEPDARRVRDGSPIFELSEVQPVWARSEENAREGRANRDLPTHIQAIGEEVGGLKAECAEPRRKAELPTS